GERLADAWQSKRETAATLKLSKHGPAWLRLNDDRKGWAVVSERAAWVRRAFAMAEAGHGVTRISAVLNALAPSRMTGKVWQPPQIQSMLRNRSVLGEYQPHVGTCAKKGVKATRKPSGDPIKGYFPAVIEEATFYRVQHALDSRRKGGGPITGVP